MTLRIPTTERHCDRCDAFIKENEEVGAIIDVYWMTRWNKLDLCPDCAKKLREWLDDPETYIAHIPIS